jgi:endonuclease YncB( thermonuclease family)
MPFVLIKGTFHIKGYAPDGDSIRFQSQNKDNWAKLSGRPVALNARGHAQLRLEAIDTLETHYNNQHQPLALADQALEFLLQRLGITGMQTDALWTSVTAGKDGIEGYILTRTTDKYGRPIAFIYSGTPLEQNGANIFLNSERLRESVNYQSLRAGLAYPTYYKGLFHDLRKACTEAVDKARSEHLGIWAQDCTNSGLSFDGLESITERNVILPKLFRRLVEFLEGCGESLEGFVQWLESRDESVFVISKAHFTHFDTLVEVIRNRVKLLEPPENLIFMD